MCGVQVLLRLDAPPDGHELRVAAFLEKRDPDFKGRTTDMPAFYPWQD